MSRSNTGWNQPYLIAVGSVVNRPCSVKPVIKCSTDGVEENRDDTILSLCWIESAWHDSEISLLTLRNILSEEEISRFDWDNGVILSPMMNFIIVVWTERWLFDGWSGKLKSFPWELCGIIKLGIETDDRVQFFRREGIISF